MWFVLDSDSVPTLHDQKPWANSFKTSYHGSVRHPTNVQLFFLSFFSGFCHTFPHTHTHSPDHRLCRVKSVFGRRARKSRFPPFRAKPRPAALFRGLLLFRIIGCHVSRTRFRLPWPAAGGAGSPGGTTCKSIRRLLLLLHASEHQRVLFRAPILTTISKIAIYNPFGPFFQIVAQRPGQFWLQTIVLAAERREVGGFYGKRYHSSNRSFIVFTFSLARSLGLLFFSFGIRYGRIQLFGENRQRS